MKHNLKIVCGCIIMLLTVVFLLQAASLAFARNAQVVEFIPTPKDRPLLETVEQVTRARVTGTCDFRFDGVHYVIVNLPKDYVDYSAWCVRMP